MPINSIYPNKDLQDSTTSGGCDAQPDGQADQINCPICGSNNFGYDLFVNLVCEDCGHIEQGTYT